MNGQGRDRPASRRFWPHTAAHAAGRQDHEGPHISAGQTRLTGTPKEWGGWDSNPGPADYESSPPAALVSMADLGRYGTPRSCSDRFGHVFGMIKLHAAADRCGSCCGLPLAAAVIAVLRDCLPTLGRRTNGGKPGREVVTMTSTEAPTPWPSDDHVSIEELARRQGVEPVESLDDLARPELWDSDEEYERFLSDLYASRRSGLT